MAHHVLRFAAGTDIGRRRKANEDPAFAGPRLLAVADGMGGHPRGDLAGRTAITMLAGRPLTGDPAAGLAAAVAEIAARLDELGRQEPELARMGTTLTAMAWDGTRFADAVPRLIDLANRAGGPDNITCVVSDVVPAADAPDAEPLLLGAASGAGSARPATTSVSPTSSAGPGCASSTCAAAPGNSRGRTSNPTIPAFPACWRTSPPNTATPPRSTCSSSATSGCTRGGSASPRRTWPG